MKALKLKGPSYIVRLGRNYFVCGNVKTTHCGIQPIKYLAPKIWDLTLAQIKHCGSLIESKNFIKSWSPNDCPCRLCKTHLAQVDFI